MNTSMPQQQQLQQQQQQQYHMYQQQQQQGQQGQALQQMQPLDQTHLPAYLSAYATRLESLVDTARPAILSLTNLAGEWVAAAPAIVAAIVKRAHTAPSNAKLPVIYLVDSILKNLGGPYVSFFAPVALDLYQAAFLAADEDQRARMLRVLATWRNPTQPFPPGVTVLPVPVIDQLEAFVRSVPRPVQPPQPTLTVPTRDMVPPNLDVLIGLRSARRDAMPHDLDNGSKLQALLDLRNLILSGRISHDQLSFIHQTVHQLFTEFTAATAHNSNNNTTNHGPHYTSPPPQPRLPAVAATMNATTSPAGPGGMMMSASALGAALAGLGPLPFTPPTLSTASVPATAAAPVAPIINLDLGALAALAASLKQGTPPLTVPAAPVQPLKSVNGLETLRFSTDSLDNKVLDQIYPPESVKCKQCGLRFPSTASSSARSPMDDHADWHFRTNTRRGAPGSSASGAPITSRLWLSASVGDWVAKADLDTAATPAFFSSFPSSGGDATSEDATDSDQQRRNQTTSDHQDGPVIVVSPSAAAGDVQCAVCMDPMTKAYDGKRDAWVIRDAVRDGEGRICHRECVVADGASSFLVLSSRDHRKRSRTPTTEDDGVVAAKRARTHE